MDYGFADSEIACRYALIEAKHAMLVVYAANAGNSSGSIFARKYQTTLPLVYKQTISH